MAKKMLGLDIGFSGINIAEITRKGRMDRVTRLGRTALPTGTVRDGKVTDVQNLRSGLERLLMEQQVSASSVVLGIRGSWLTIKAHNFPVMPKRDLEKALEFEVPELVSFPVESLDDVFYDYFINSKGELDLEVVLVACPAQIVRPFIDVIRGVGLSLEAVDVAAFGWNDLLESPGRRVFVEIGEEQTTIQVALDRVFKVHRVIPIGSTNFRQGVEEAFACSPEEACSLCEKEELDYLLLEGSGNKRVFRATVQQFVGSILQTLDFVRAQERATSFRGLVDELVLLGDLVDLKGLSSMLEKEVELPVQTLKEIQNLRVALDVIRPTRFSSYGSALALGLRGLS